MNRSFSEYSTSTAFAVMLSKNQCNALLRLDALGDVEKYTPEHMLLTVQSLRPLDARGLVWWQRGPDGKRCAFKGLTTAGNLMVALLKEAGLTVENTNTIGMLNRIDRLGVGA